MKAKRSLTLHGHRTSVALEPVFWEVLDDVAARDSRSLAGLVQEIDDGRTSGPVTSGLASHLRVWCVRELRRRLRDTPSSGG